MEPTNKQCVRHMREILAIFSRIDADTKEQGRAWYREEHDSLLIIAREARQPVRTVCACLAVLSPRCQWRRAKEALALVLAGRRPAGIFTRSVKKARRILTATSGIPINPRTAPKTWAFWRNLWRPCDPEPVTLDSWMFDAHGLPKNSGLRSYETLAEAYRTLAPELGLIPNQLQATVWLHIKERARHG